MTPLHWASAYGHLPVVEALLAAGANINATTKHGDTPLHKASYWGRLPVVGALLAFSLLIVIACISSGDESSGERELVPAFTRCLRSRASVARSGSRRRPQARHSVAQVVRGTEIMPARVGHPRHWPLRVLPEGRKRQFEVGVVRGHAVLIAGGGVHGVARGESDVTWPFWFEPFLLLPPFIFPPASSAGAREPPPERRKAGGGSVG